MPKSKRAVKDVPIFLDSVFEQLNKLLEAPPWHYKTNTAAFELRDKALFSLLILTGGRASEIGLLKRSQLNIAPANITIVNFETLKHGLLRKEIILPRSGALGIYTEVVLEWLKEIPSPESYIIPAGDPYGNFVFSRGLGRKRIWAIIKFRTGLFPHWFRGVHETIYARKIFLRDAWKLKEYMGYKNIESTTAYISGEIEAEDLKRLKNL